MNRNERSIPAAEPVAGPISFGMSRLEDEKSLALFLAKFSDPALLEVMIPRLTDQEILALVDTLSGLLRSHLDHREYHRLFLGG